MKLKKMVGLFAALSLAVPLAAQMFGPKVPTLSGIWHPVVGTGAVYDITKGGRKSQIEISILGKENVDGKSAFWQEMVMNDSANAQQWVGKALVTVSDAGITTERMVIQMPGRPPMEMDGGMGMPGRSPKQTVPVTIVDKAEVVGTETVTVPAGTFSCTHYRMKDGSGDAWVSDKVTPWGLVKSEDKDNTMVLSKVLTDAKDHITGTPEKFDPMQMMRRGQGQ